MNHTESVVDSQKHPNVGIANGAEDDLQRFWKALYGEQAWNADPNWWVQRDVACIATRPAAGAQGERARILKRNDFTRPIYNRWLACKAAAPCRTPHCLRCNGPRGSVQTDLCRRVTRLFADVSRSEIQVVTHHLEPVVLNSALIDESADRLTARITAGRAALIKRLQRHAPDALVFGALEAEPKRIRDTPTGVYPDQGWRQGLPEDTIIALVHVHALIWDPDNRTERVWLPPRGRKPGSRQTHIQPFQPTRIGVALDGDGLGYAAGYGIKRRTGGNFGDQTEAIFLIGSLVLDRLGPSGAIFFAGERRKRRAKKVPPRSPIDRQDAPQGIEPRKQVYREKKQSFGRGKTSFDSHPHFCCRFIVVRLFLSIRTAPRARGPPHHEYDTHVCTI